MSLSEDFHKSIVHLKKMTELPYNQELLQLYGLYKQIKEGNIKQERPRHFDFKQIAKYDAWKAMEGKSEKECMGEYIRLVRKLTDS